MNALGAMGAGVLPEPGTALLLGAGALGLALRGRLTFRTRT
jgi:hypothetical protein